MKKVYIVDDDRNIVESLSLVLKKEGFQTAAQYHQNDIIENVKKFGPDCIILDVMFPENVGAGFEIARELRSNSETKNIPILMLSAINERGVYAGTFSNKDRDEEYLPVDEFIEKPINPKLLVEKVKQLVSKI